MYTFILYVHGDASVRLKLNYHGQTSDLRAGRTLQKDIEERFTGHYHDTRVSEKHHYHKQWLMETASLSVMLTS